MKKQILSTLLSVSMLGTLLTFPTSVVNAEAADFTVTATTPQDGAEMVSAIDDVVITFSNNVDKETVADGISFSGSESYQLVTKKNTVMVIFDKELAYLTDYKVTLDEDLKDVDGNALTPYEFSFETEYNPITTLFYSDFEGTEAEELAKFTHGENQTPVTADMGFYSVIEDPKNPENHVLNLNPTSSWNSYYPIFKGSNTWAWYDADYQLAVNGNGTRVFFLLKGAKYGYLANNDSTCQRDVIQHQFVNANYTQFQSYRESRLSSLYDYFARIPLSASAQSYGAGIPFVFGKLTDVNVNFTGSGGASKPVYSFLDKTSAAYPYYTGTEAKTYDVMATQQGATGIFSTAGNSYIDNVNIQDIGWYPKNSAFNGTPERKNIGDTLNIYFDGEIKDNASSSITVTSPTGEVVSTAVSVVNVWPRHIEISLDSLIPNTEYTVTIPQGSLQRNVAGDATSKYLSNDKVFTVKTPYVDSALSVVSTTPAMGATDVAVKSNVTIDFSAAVNFATLDGNITVEGAPDFTIEEIDEDTIALVFDERLDYGKSYTVTLSNAILSADGEEFSGYSFNFTTLESTFAVSNSSIADGSRDVSVLDDLVVYFNDAVDFDTLEGNITVSPEADFNLVELDNGAIIEFKDALEYYTNYTVNFSGDIATVDGMPLSEKAITFKTAPDMGKALFYENFDGDEATAQARFTEIGSENRNSSENFYVGTGALNLPSYYDGGTNQADKTVAQIVGSENWGNIELDFDAKIPDFRNLATSVGGSIDVRFRQGTYGSSESWINFNLGDSSNNGILKASMSRNNLNVVDPYISDVSIDYTDATTTPDWINNKLLFTGTQGNAIVDYEMNAYGKTVTASFDSKNAPEGYRETYVIPTGSVQSL